jgi:hypothetical protein
MTLRDDFVAAHAQLFNCNPLVSERMLRGIEVEYAEKANTALGSDCDQLAAEYGQLMRAVLSTATSPNPLTSGGIEPSRLIEYLAWLPDLIRHQEAQRMLEHDPLAMTMLGTHSRRIDPFEKKLGHYADCDVVGEHWHRKSDGVLVLGYLLDAIEEKEPNP